MSAGQSKSGNDGTLGIGGATSGEEGSTLTHETMAETGGSGGDALTKPKNEEEAESGHADPDEKRQGDALQHSVDVAAEPEGAGTGATATARGAQDTRSHQAGIQQTGLGTPETGGNQSEEDLAPPRQK
jgi:hypothetical protein